MNATSARSSRSAVTLVLERGALGTPGAAPAPAPARTTTPAPGEARDRRVLVVAHRGLPGPRRRENSVRAVEAALNRGADGVEVDVRLSSDGVLVCSHDPVVRTTTGPDLMVSSTTARQLRHATGDDGDRLATVHEVLAAASRHRRCQLVIEAKPVPDHATARRTAEVLRGVLQLPLPDGLEVTVSSFDNALLALVRAGLPAGVRTALLGRRAEPVHAVLHQAARSGHAEAHLHVAALRQAPHAIALAHHLGVRVTSWTVNGRDDLQRLARWGVDAVITDNVVAAQVLLNGAREASSPELGRGAAC